MEIDDDLNQLLELNDKLQREFLILVYKRTEGTPYPHGLGYKLDFQDVIDTLDYPYDKILIALSTCGRQELIKSYEGGKLGKTGICLTDKGIEFVKGIIQTSLKQFNSEEERRKEINRLFQKGLSDDQIGYNVALGGSRVKQIRLEMGLKRRPGRKN